MSGASVAARCELTDCIHVQDASVFFVLPDGFVWRRTPRTPLVGETWTPGAVTFGSLRDGRIAKAEVPTRRPRLDTLSRLHERDQAARWTL